MFREQFSKILFGCADMLIFRDMGSTDQSNLSNWIHQHCYSNVNMVHGKCSKLKAENFLKLTQWDHLRQCHPSRVCHPSQKFSCRWCLPVWVIQGKGDPVENIRALFSSGSFFSLDHLCEVDRLHHFDRIIWLISAKCLLKNKKRLFFSKHKSIYYSHKLNVSKIR